MVQHFCRHLFLCFGRFGRSRSLSSKQHMCLVCHRKCAKCHCPPPRGLSRLSGNRSVDCDSIIVSRLNDLGTKTFGAPVRLCVSRSGCGYFVLCGHVSAVGNIDVPTPMPTPKASPPLARIIRVNEPLRERSLMPILAQSRGNIFFFFLYCVWTAVMNLLMTIAANGVSYR